MKKYKVGFTMGVFDLFHVGHLNLPERCKELCDYLIVAVCGDDYVTQVKKKTPVFTEKERIRIIGALKCVDEVSIITLDEIDDKMKAWERFHFDVLFPEMIGKAQKDIIERRSSFPKLAYLLNIYHILKVCLQLELKRK